MIAAIAVLACIGIPLLSFAIAVLVGKAIETGGDR